MARKLTTYIVYYEDKDGDKGGYEVYGYKDLMKAMKWLHSEEIKAKDITIYKQGKNFENDKDDIIEVYTNLWK